MKNAKYKNVFILSTGRCGSMSFARACDHITNYSSAHESLTRELGDKRLDYPAYHIESDNRLSWFLGRLDEKYGDSAYYVHLYRDRLKTAESYNARWGHAVGIMPAYTKGIRMTGVHGGLDDCLDYYDTVNSNIRLFLRDKSHTMTIPMEEMTALFPVFCANIGAEVDMKQALQTLSERHNKRTQPDKASISVRAKYHARKSMKILKQLPTIYRETK